MEKTTERTALYEARAGVWNVLTDLIADYPMWIGDDGKPLDYSPQREAAISDFIAEATEGIEPVISRLIAAAEQRGYDRCLDDERDLMDRA